MNLNLLPLVEISLPLLPERKRKAPFQRTEDVQLRRLFRIQLPNSEVVYGWTTRTAFDLLLQEGITDIDSILLLSAARENRNRPHLIRPSPRLTEGRRRQRLQWLKKSQLDAMDRLPLFRLRPLLRRLRLSKLTREMSLPTIFTRCGPQLKSSDRSQHSILSSLVSTLFSFHLSLFILATITSLMTPHFTSIDTLSLAIRCTRCQFSLQGISQNAHESNTGNKVKASQQCSILQFL
jgi:hypothetical protein